MAGRKEPLISRVLFVLLLCALCLYNVQTPREQTEQETGRQLIDMSIEELMEVPVMCDSDSTLNPVTETEMSGTGCA